MEFVSTNYDVANAFPSVAHAALDTMLGSVAHEADAKALKVRYTNSWMLVKGANDEEILLRPGCGGLQGDSCTPGMARRSDHGVVKIIVERASRRVLGAHIMGEEASDMIHLFIVLLKKQGTLDDLLDMIFIHPALPEVARDAARNAQVALKNG